MASYPKHINHELSPMACPADLDAVDLFGDGAAEHWYEAYEILHREAPVLRIEGGGVTPGTDAFVLTKHADVARVVKDPDRFPSLTHHQFPIPIRPRNLHGKDIAGKDRLCHFPSFHLSRRAKVARARSLAVPGSI